MIRDDIRFINLCLGRCAVCAQKESQTAANATRYAEEGGGGGENSKSFSQH
jgi:hypothetical protein